MKQLGRELREASKEGDDGSIKQARVAQLRFELKVFKERVDRYPTDLRLKYELAQRRFNAGQFDEAIPLLQAARADPKNRAACGVYLGRCFFRKGYHDQAVTALEEVIREYDGADEELSKSMQYWLGRAQEAGGARQEAQKTYGAILQLDYNYKDVRARLDALQGKDVSG